MDPITAVGFAASILTFIDFGREIVTGTLEVIKSGSTKENTHIGIVVNDLLALVKPLSEKLPGKSDHEKALTELAAKCKDVSQDLVDLLERMKRSSDSPKWESVRVALRSMRKKGEVRELESKLDKYRSEILLRLTFILNEGQLSIQVQLNDFRTQVQKQSSDALKQLTGLQHDIIAEMERSMRQNVSATLILDRKNSYTGEELVPGITSEGTEGTRNEQLKLLQEVREKLAVIIQSQQEPLPEVRVLKQLYDSSLYRREESIEKASDDTFAWILDEKPAAISARVDDAATAGETTPADDLTPAEGSSTAEASTIVDDSTLASHATSAGDATPADNSPLLDDRAAQTRSEATSRLLTWLRSGNNVFHISGKAGSGKSTLLKFLADHEKTKQELEHWAGNERLVFAPFFFWRSGAAFQRSLEGLYRTILFEILLQCPELIQYVFPEAHGAFSRKKPGECIDDIFFRPKLIEKAFQNLVSIPRYAGYTFCLFIDGLDEYGDDDVDDWEYEKLAEHLNAWTSKGGVKILASSRPRKPFENTFANELRIRLHTLTRLDIILFGCNMFENHKAFERPEIKACYKNLVERVADSAEGVFLWAVFAIRALLNSARYALPDSLKQQLEVIPKDVKTLYRKMFELIDPVEQIKAFKILLLVANNRYGPLNALCVTWLDDLDNPDFPFKSDFKPYTEDEIMRRRIEAEYQIDGLTKSLLEVSTSRYYKRNTFFQGQIQFFHRTVRDFVLESKAILDYSQKFPELTKSETYGRIQLAELHFSSSRESHGFGYSLLFELLKQDRQSSVRRLLDGYWEALDYHNKEICGYPRFTRADWCLKGGRSIDKESDKEEPASFLHWATRFNAVDYIQEKLAAHPEWMLPKDDLSLLLSAALSDSHKMAKTLLDSGASPHDRVRVSIGGRDSTLTVWRSFCCYIACSFINDNPYRNLHYRLSIWRILECFLEAGVEHDCYILVVSGDFQFKGIPTPTHIISLRDLVQQVNPPNLQRLMDLMREKKQGILNSTWKYLRSAISTAHDDTLFRPEDYISFSFDMDPNPPENESQTDPESTTSETDSSFTEDEDIESNLANRWIVYSLQFPDMRIDTINMRIRLD